ncbi:MAG TPA: penicillin-binding protein [Sphingobacteriaceae bacterium]|nr:penicillin-binding protein [Sphingobacteriaceae bacterium]
MNIRTDILLRVYLAFGVIMLFAFAVLFKLFNVQFSEGRKWRSMADSLSTKFVNVEAARGNIYSVDGSLMATSVPEYELRMDMLAGGVAKDEVFYEKVDSLAQKLSMFFGDKSTSRYSQILRESRADRLRYVLLKRKVSYQDLKIIRKFPIFNLGKYKGGLIAVQQNKRILPFRSLAARTIGYKNENVQPVGLEGAYGSYINGETGKRLMQRIAGGIWMPVNRDIEIAPKDGSDIISTIDINMQDVAQRALEKQLIKSNADHGSVILMEVSTGEIRAVANYTKVADSIYQEKFNYAIAASAEPGSTFKLASYLVAMEDGKFDLDDLVDTQGGKIKFSRNTISDSHEGGYGVITMKKAFEVSSNVAITKMIYKNYRDNPSDFTDRLHELHLGEPLSLQIPGEGIPLIKTPKSRSWSKLTLPWMAYGYELKMTPLQMLAFYNAVANNGRMISPLFVREIRQFGQTVEHFQTKEISNKICSDKTLAKLKQMLEGVVNEEGGTGAKLKNPLYKIAGKTGTAQVAQGAGGYAKKQYQASFCGYFPADNPKYSMIVVIHNPDRSKGSYYAADVAGPVFKEVADKVYARDVRMFDKISVSQYAGNSKTPEVKGGDNKSAQRVYQALGIKALQVPKTRYTKTLATTNDMPFQEANYTHGSVPNVNGMGLKDALYMIGNSGLRPLVKGSGKVVRQSLVAGTRIIKGYPIVLELQ